MTPIFPRHRDDPRWFYVAIQVPMMVAAIAFAPKVESAVNAPVTATVNAALCRAFPAAVQCQMKVSRHER